MVLGWKSGGALLGLVFFVAVLLVKPVGVSTEFVIFDGLLWKAFDSTAVVADPAAKGGYSSPNAYLNKYARHVANPLTYGVVFVLSILVGAGLSARLRGGVAPRQRAMPVVWRVNYGDEPWRRYLAAFAAGFLVLYGARLAGGCTSGHMMSGMMQTAVSGYIFAAGVFLVAIPLAIVLYRKEG